MFDIDGEDQRFMKRIRGANLKAQHANETEQALESLQVLDEDQCRMALESLQAKRDGPGIDRAEFITILALRMRAIEFESVIT